MPGGCGRLGRHGVSRRRRTLRRGGELLRGVERLPDRRVRGGDHGVPRVDRHLRRGREVLGQRGGVSRRSERGERDGVLGRQRVHAERHVPVGDLHRREPGDLRGERSVPHRRRVQHRDGSLQQPREGERERVQRRERVHDQRYVPVWRVRGSEPGGCARRRTRATWRGRATRRRASARTRSPRTAPRAPTGTHAMGASSALRGRARRGRPRSSTTATRARPTPAVHRPA